MASIKEKKYRHLRLCRSCKRRESGSVPSLLLDGLWLESAGFGIGDMAEVTVHRNKLVITIKERWRLKR